MTIEEKIHIFENSRLVSENFTEEALTAAYVEALSTLRAQQEAEKDENGCKYCRDGAVIALDMCDDAIRVETDGKAGVLAADSWECEINYCPMCGRPLRRTGKGGTK